MNNLDTCDFIASYSIFSLARTPDEEASLISFWTPERTAEECARHLHLFRANQGRRRRRRRSLQIMTSNDIVEAAADPSTDVSLDRPDDVSEQQWRVVLLRMEGYTFAEISEIVGASRQSCQLWVEKVREVLGRRSPV